MKSPRLNGKSGTALVATLILVALMLTLTLYYAALVRMQERVSGFGRARHLADLALTRAYAEAVETAETDLRNATNRVDVLPGIERAWLSRGTGGAFTGAVNELLAETLGLPTPLRGSGPDSLVSRLAGLEWQLEGATNAVHQLYAWAVIPLHGLLDPQGMRGWQTDALGYVPTEPAPVYFSAREFALAHPAAVAAFLPGSFSRDPGWFDFDAAVWRSSTLLEAETLSLHPADWTPAQIRLVFASLYPALNADELTEAFLDFREGRRFPTNPDGLTAVPVPMMNELHAWLEIENLGTQIRVRHQFSLEIWRPFPGNPDPDRYRVTTTPSLRARESGSAAFALSGLEPDEEWTFAAPGGNADAAFALLTLDVLQTLPALPEGTAVDLDWEVGGLELERVDAGVVDRLPAGLMLSLPRLLIPPSGGVERVEFTLEVTDPRINHQQAQWIAATQSTLQAVNRVALDAREEAGVWRDDFVCWTPADTTGGWRESWAGFFPLGEPWRSVDLLAEEGRWWLRHTRAVDWREDAVWRRGRVNPNAAYPEALSAVFRGLPLADWPGQPDAESAEAALAQRLAADLSAAWQLGEGSRQRGDWTAAMRPALREAGVSPARAESLVAASLERLTVNHQIWGLLLWSRTVGPGGRVLASRREFVIRWIEPQAEAAGPLRSAVLWRCGFSEN